MFLLLSTNGIQAQTTNAKLNQIIELPQLSLEQKLDRSARNTTTRDIVGIAYAKSLGKTPEDFGRYIGEHTAFFWGISKVKVQCLLYNIGIDFSKQIEIRRWKF